MNLEQLSINAAEELQRLKIGEKTNLKNTYELSKLKEFNNHENSNHQSYSTRFREAYFWTYKKEVPNSVEKSREYTNNISKKLKNIQNKNSKEIENLANFCSNLSDSFQLCQEELESLKGPCFR